MSQTHGGNLRTHEVQNQPSALENYNLFVSYLPLRQALEREGAGWAAAACTTFGEALGSAEVIRLGHDANRFLPELRVFDRWGRRLDEVEFHPAYHQLMERNRCYRGCIARRR